MFHLTFLSFFSFGTSILTAEGSGGGKLETTNVSDLLDMYCVCSCWKSTCDMVGMSKICDSLSL